MTTQRKIEPGSNDLVFNLYTHHYGPGRDNRDDLTSYGTSWDRTPTGRYFVPEHLSFSDYSGCMVERANVKAFSEEYSAGEDAWWFRAIGGHGTEAVVVDSHGIPDDLRDDVHRTLSGLYDYPSIDDDLVSHMEMDADEEAWTGWVRSDFVRELASHVEGAEYPGDTLSDATDKMLHEVFHATAERKGIYFETETGGGRYIDVKRVAAWVTDADRRRLIRSGRRRAAK